MDALKCKTIAIDYVGKGNYAVIEVDEKKLASFAEEPDLSPKIIAEGPCPLTLLRNWTNAYHPPLIDFIGGVANLATTRLQVIPSEIVQTVVEMQQRENMQRAKNLIRTACEKAKIDEKTDPKASTPVSFGKARKKTKPEETA